MVINLEKRNDEIASVCVVDTCDDEEAIALISSVRGIGRWSAEIYLLFAEGRAEDFMTRVALLTQET